MAENMSVQEKALQAQRKVGRLLTIFNLVFTIVAIGVGVYAFSIIK